MNKDNYIKQVLKKIKQSLKQQRTNTHTENLFYLVQEGLEDNKKREIKYSENVSDEFFYAFGYEYEKENKELSFKAIDLLEENYPGLYIDTTYYCLKACYGNFDKGYLISLCWNMNITPEVKNISEERNEAGKTVIKEIITFTKPYNKNLIKKRK